MLKTVIPLHFPDSPKCSSESNEWKLKKSTDCHTASWMGRSPPIKPRSSDRGPPVWPISGPGPLHYIQLPSALK